MATHRTIVEEPLYAAQLDAIREQYSSERVDSALDGLMWGIAQNPEKYDRVTWNIFQAVNRTFGSRAPQLRIFFSLKGDNEVTLQWIEEMTAMDEILEAVQ